MYVYAMYMVQMSPEFSRLRYYMPGIGIQHIFCS